MFNKANKVSNKRTDRQGGHFDVTFVVGSSKVFVSFFEKEIIYHVQLSLKNGPKDLYSCSFIYICIHLQYKWGMKMVQKNVTLSLDEDTYEKYREFCKKNAVALSRSIEVFMEEKTKNEEK